MAVLSTYHAKPGSDSYGSQRSHHRSHQGCRFSSPLSAHLAEQQALAEAAGVLAQTRSGLQQLQRQTLLLILQGRATAGTHTAYLTHSHASRCVRHLPSLST